MERSGVEAQVLLVVVGAEPAVAVEQVLLGDGRAAGREARAGHGHEELEPAGVLAVERVDEGRVHGAPRAALGGRGAAHAAVVPEHAVGPEEPARQPPERLGQDVAEGHERHEGLVGLDAEGVHPLRPVVPLVEPLVEVERLELVVHDVVAAVVQRAALPRDHAVHVSERLDHLVEQVRHEAPAGEGQQHVEQRVDVGLDGLDVETLGHVTRVADEHLHVRHLLRVLRLDEDLEQGDAAGPEEGEQGPARSEEVGADPDDGEADDHAGGENELVHGSFLDFPCLMRQIGDVWC